MEHNNYKCEFCDKSFSSASNLITHKRTAKFCLKIQQEKFPNVEIKKREFKCELCANIFKNKNLLNSHITICKIENDQKTIINIYENKIFKLQYDIEIKDREIENLKDINSKEIETLKNELFKKDIEIAELNGILKSKTEILNSEHECILQMAKQPKTNTNNNIQNILAPLNLDTVLHKFNNVNFTNKDIIDGQAGVARLLAPCLIDNTGKKMLKISDISRGIFTSIDNDGNIMKDIKAQKLAIAIEPIAIEKVNKIIELDDIKRGKIIDLCMLRKNIKERRNEIDKFNNTLLGISSKITYNYYIEQINRRIKQNEIEQEQIVDYIAQGIDEITVEEMDLILVKMKDGLEDIKELNSNSNKFSSTLSKVIE